MDKDDFESLKRGLAEAEAFTADHSGLQHEALHATHMISAMFDQFIVEHSYVQALPDIRDAAGKISDALGELYQLIGGKG